jgi:hypothetical protein
MAEKMGFGELGSPNPIFSIFSRPLGGPNREKGFDFNKTLEIQELPIDINPVLLYTIGNVAGNITGIVIMVAMSYPV